MITDMTFETNRLNVKSWHQILKSYPERKALATELKHILTPSVLKHLPEPLQLKTTEGAVEDWMLDRASESDVYIIRDKAAALVGLLILAKPHKETFPMTIHLGYLLAESVWGKGYGSELIAGLITWFEDIGEAVQLFGGVDKENVASARVLEKNGFILDHTASETETDMFGLYIPTNYDRLYQTTKEALGAPNKHITEFFETQFKKPMRVLDVGCGQGRDAIFIARLGHEVVGVDISPNGVNDMLAKAKQENLPIKGVVDDLTRFHPTGDFDIILIDRTLHMLSQKEMIIVLERLINHVLPQGWVFIVDEPSNIVDFKAVFSSSQYEWGTIKDDNGYLLLRRT